ncbi:MAG TPA: RtcB family protein [Candidatus Binataceae bacterium]|nr:RtcB family protein [Candidatus Binataceae bacterium]
MQLIRRSDWLWEIPQSGSMRVPGRIYATARMIEEMRNDPCLNQVANVASLPGIVGYSLAMPDIHWGYGFPIGGVAAVDAEDGVISPGGVGYDINCGVRLARTALEGDFVEPRIERLANTLFAKVPAGLGSGGALPGLSSQQIKLVAYEGMQWAVRNGYASGHDVDHTEENGRLPGADPERITERAFKRGSNQLGTLGSGNHFLEVSRIDQIYDARVADAFGLHQGQVTVLIHSGSRGLGHQTCDDYLKVIVGAMARYGVSVPDRQLAAVPINSPEGKAYLGAMAAAANFAWCNRQLMMHLAEQAFLEALSISPRDLDFSLVYDVCHNIAKFEEHVVDGRVRRLCMHRKGATRAYPAGHPVLPEPLRPFGQPVLIPGDMGRYSFVLVGLEAAMHETFGSSCHGAGRLMSRSAAKKDAKGRDLPAELKELGVTIRAHSRGGIAEEMPGAYKDVAEVVEVMEAAGITKRVARLRPLAVIKG